MEELLFVMMAAVLICVVIVLAKLNKIERLLRSESVPDKDRPGQSSRPTAQPADAPVPPVPPPSTARPVPCVTASRPSLQPPKSEAHKPTKEPTVWNSFWAWFCVGGRDRSDVSVEYAAATTWLVRAGIIILLCGIGFFLKYSIERNLIRPELRIALTFIVGLAMLIGGLRGIRKRFHILAVGVLSAGVITLYMGSYAGCRIYTVLPMAFCFALMVLTTVAAMTVSATLALLPVALTGCAGAYLTPVLLSDGSGNLPFLCCYTALVSAGVLIVSRLHRWRGLEIAAFVSSALIFAVGAAKLPNRIDFLCLAAVFVNFLVFSLIPLIRKRDAALGLTEWLLPIFGAVWGLALGICMIVRYDLSDEIERFAMAGYAVLLSAVTLAEGIALEKRRPDGAKLQPAFLCASVFALALAIPLALHGTGANVSGWSVLAAVLILAAAKSGKNTFAVLGVIVFATALIVIGETNTTSATFVGRFFRGGVFTVALFAAAFFLRNKTDKLMCEYRSVFQWAAGVSFVIYTSVEIFRQLEAGKWTHHFRHGGLSIWWAILAVLLVAGGIRRNLKALRVCGLALFIVCLVKVYTIDISGLNTLGKVIAFVLLGLLFLGGAAAYIQYRKRFAPEADKEEEK